MATAIVMPKAGNSVEECFLSKWNIKVGAAKNFLDAFA